MGFALYNGASRLHRDGYAFRWFGYDRCHNALHCGDVTPGAVQSVFSRLTTDILRGLPPPSPLKAPTAAPRQARLRPSRSSRRSRPRRLAAKLDNAPRRRPTQSRFGSSVTAVKVTPSTGLAGASSNYMVSFTAGSDGDRGCLLERARRWHGVHQCHRCSCHGHNWRLAVVPPRVCPAWRRGLRNGYVRPRHRR